MRTLKRARYTSNAQVLHSATMKAILSAVVTAILVMSSVPAQVQPLQTITINYPTRSGASWPLFLAKEGGYYQKYGLDVDLVFAGHPAGIAMVVSGEAQMSSYNLESVMQASVQGRHLHRRRQLGQPGVLRADVAEGYRERQGSERQDDRRQPDRRPAVQLHERLPQASSG